jgi:choline dehydrogenase-like flavoprotein
VVEAGGRVAETLLRSAENAGRTHLGTKLGRAFGLGGTSTLWGGQLGEFDAADLVKPGREWPLAYSELSTFYQRVYGAFGISPFSDREYRKKFGEEQSKNLNVERYFTHWLRQPSLVALFRAELSNNLNPTVVLNASVCDISFESRVAKTVIAVVPGGRKVRIAAQNFIFACGTIESSRFFLTMQRQENIPWRDNGNVGTYFQDHLGGKVATVQVTNEKRLREYFENCFVDGFKLQPKIRFTPQQRCKVAIGIAGELNFESDLTASFSYSTRSSLPADLKKVARALIPIVVRYVKDRRVYALYDRAPELYIQSEQIPMADSRIRITDHKNPQDQLFDAVVDWKVSGAEIDTIHDYCLLVDEYLGEQQIGRLQIVPPILARDALALGRLEDTYHQCGGMCMSTSPASGVVDPDCKVWNTENVYVAGASVFPTSSHANCTLTALTLACRLAAEISERS